MAERLTTTSNKVSRSAVCSFVTLTMARLLTFPIPFDFLFCNVPKRATTFVRDQDQIDVERVAFDVDAERSEWHKLSNIGMILVVKNKRTAYMCLREGASTMPLLLRISS